jgi:hypothetical protein
MSPNSTMPKTSAASRRPLMRIQPTLSDTAAVTSSTHSVTKNAIVFWRRVTRQFYG